MSQQSCSFFADVFVGAFMDTQSNREAIAVGVDYLQVVGMCYILMGIMNSYTGILRGAGDVKWFLAVTLFNLGARVALAYLLSPVFGYRAIWWSIPIGWVIGLVLGIIRYQKRRLERCKADLEKPNMSNDRELYREFVVRFPVIFCSDSAVVNL